MGKRLKYLFLIFICLGSVLPAVAQTPLWKTLPQPPPLPKPDESGLISVNGIRMYYAIFNKKHGAPVLLLHGGLGSSEDWGFSVPELEKNHEVIVVDCRGRGRTSLGNQPLSYELMESDVVRLLEALKIKNVSVVGWSDGGIIGLLMGIHDPERINKLYCFGANFSRSGNIAEPVRDSAVAARYFARVKETYRRLSPEPDSFPELLKAIGRMYAVEPEINPEDLKTIRVPTVIADGQYEQFFTREHIEELAHLIPHARLYIIPETSHGGPVQDPLHFNHSVMELIDDSHDDSPK